MASSPRQPKPLPEVEQEFRDQVKTYFPRIKQFLHGKVRDRYAQDEILSETIAMAWKQYQNGERVENFKGWFLQILKFKTVEYFRNERVKGFAGAEREEFNEELHTGTGTGTGTDAHIDWEKIKAKLTKDEGELLYKHWGEERSYAEIAKEMGQKEATVRQQCNRASKTESMEPFSGATRLVLIQNRPCTHSQ